MSFCGECGTPLPNPVQTSPNIQEFPTQSLPNKTSVWEPNRETDTLEANKFNFASTPPPPKSSSGSKAFLIFGGILGLFGLVVITAVGIIIYNLIPDKKPIVTVKQTPSPNVSPTPKITPNVSFTPPTAPTKQGSFIIYANQGWQLSNIDTVANEKFQTTVQGKIDLAGIKNGVSSDGVDDAKTKSRRIYPEFPTGALIMRTRYADGKFSNIVALTANGANGSWENGADEIGKIEFCINDNAPQSNGGQFSLTVTLTPEQTNKK